MVFRFDVLAAQILTDPDRVLHDQLAQLTLPNGGNSGKICRTISGQ